MSGIDNLMESLVKNAERIVALRTERDELRRVLELCLNEGVLPQYLAHDVRKLLKGDA